VSVKSGWGVTLFLLRITSLYQLFSLPQPPLTTHYHHHHHASKTGSFDLSVGNTKQYRIWILLSHEGKGRGQCTTLLWFGTNFVFL
jgi:hypothetical protein